MAYCFANIPGYSKAGYYVGNGNADGPFTYTGFRPAMVLIKDTNNNEDWWMVDYKRSPYNVTDKIITPDQNIAEVQDTGYFGDMVSNGFKMKSTNVSFNASGNYYTYLAFAEFPLVSSNDVPTVAR